MKRWWPGGAPLSRTEPGIAGSTDGFSAGGRLAWRPAHWRGAVGAGALPNGQPAGQLQLLEEGHGSDVGCLGTLAGAQRQHAADHTQLLTENTRGLLFKKLKRYLVFTLLGLFHILSQYNHKFNAICLELYVRRWCTTANLNRHAR